MGGSAQESGASSAAFSGITDSWAGVKQNSVILNAGITNG